MSFERFEKDCESKGLIDLIFWNMVDFNYGATKVRIKRNFLNTSNVANLRKIKSLIIINICTTLKTIKFESV